MADIFVSLQAGSTIFIVIQPIFLAVAQAVKKMGTRTHTLLTATK